MNEQVLKLHQAMLSTIEALVAMDPPKDSPEGRLLVGLAAAVEEFEKTAFPFKADGP